MTNLPITNNAPQAATPAKPAANNAETSDASGSQPFNEVLARQAQEPTAKNAKAGDKLAADALAQLGADTASAKDVGIAADAAGSLPADMLAALLPQAMNQQAAVSTGGKASGNEDILAGKSGMATLAADARITAGTTAKTSAEVNLGAQLRGDAFSAALAGKKTDTPADLDLSASLSSQAPAAPQLNAAALASLQTTTAPAAQAMRMTIDTPVAQDKWGDEFGQKITWLASANQDQSAELHLNPPQLGPLDVVIKVSGDQATALFTSPHAAVRDAVEQALPKLRDMLADNGIMLGNATVSDQAPRDQSDSRPQQSAGSARDELRDTPVAAGSPLRVSQISRHNGIVDTFA